MISNKTDLDDHIMYTSMKLLMEEYPNLIVQPPSIIQGDGYHYCPSETIQITHNSKHHWLLLSTIGGCVNIYDSLHMNVTESLKRQIIQLFSPDGCMPAYKIMECQKQVGSTDCGLFAIANAIEIILGNDLTSIVFDQSMMRTHLISCFEKGKLVPFPKYRVEAGKKRTSSGISPQKDDMNWQIPRRSNRIRNMKNMTDSQKEIKLNNRFTTSSAEKCDMKPLDNKKQQSIHHPMKNKCKSDIILNISNSTLNINEQNVLEKGLNFCPTVKLPDKMRVLDDLYRFCRKLKLKEYFYNPDLKKVADETDKNPDEKCDIHMNTSNRYFHPPRDPSNALATYISAIKHDVTDMINKPNHLKSNLTNEERDGIASLKKRKDVLIQSADKGGKVVVMDRQQYIKMCEEDLSNKEYYEELSSDPTKEYVNEIVNTIKDLRKEEMLTEKEEKFLSQHLNDPHLPNFYALPKIHKSFSEFPPLRPIVSNIKSCTRRLSEFIDSYLKYQAQRCSSFIKDTKHFLQKIVEINKSKLPPQSILVTMDVAALYTNIDHEEGAEACRIKLEERTKKTLSSNSIKKLINLVLKCTAFEFGSKVYRQIKGTCMGTPMAPNYANLFMDHFENCVINEYFAKTGFKPLVWYRYIDDIFFIWTNGSESLDDFISFIQGYSSSKEMKSSIKFDTNISPSEVNFLDVKVKLNDGHLETDLYTKPTDAFLYLNSSSNHPKHVKSNIPKGQFIRIRRICSNTKDYLKNCKYLSSFFENRGYSSRDLKKTIRDVLNMPRDNLLVDKIKTPADPQMIFVADWHQNLSRLPSILRKHHHILQNGIHTKDIFTSNPIVAYRRPKTIRNAIIRNKLITDSEKNTQTKVTSTKPCGKCKLCPNIYTAEKIKNEKKEITITLNDGGNCQTKNIVYACVCTRHNIICVGHTGDSLATRFSKHRYDIKKRPKNSEIAEHFSVNHSENDLRVLILQSGLKDAKERQEFEDKWMCKLQTIQAPDSSGINKDHGNFVKEMYQCCNELK